MTRSVSPTRVVLAVGAVASALLLAGCGAGQITQTSTQLPGVDGASATVGQIAVRNALLPFAGDGKTAVVYPSGGTAPLSAFVVNSSAQPDKLVSGSSPAAASVEIIGDGTVSSGKLLIVQGEPAGTSTTEPPAASGPAGPQVAPTVRPAAPTPAGPNAQGTTSAQVVLTGLKQDLKAGGVYPVVLTFQRAGDVTLQVPVGNPGEGSSNE